MAFLIIILLLLILLLLLLQLLWVSFYNCPRIMAHDSDAFCEPESMWQFALKTAVVACGTSEEGYATLSWCLGIFESQARATDANSLTQAFRKSRFCAKREVCRVSEKQKRMRKKLSVNLLGWGLGDLEMWRGGGVAPRKVIVQWLFGLKPASRREEHSMALLVQIWSYRRA